MPQSAPSLSHFRAVIFDLDGTLIDSYDAIAASVNYVRARHKLPLLPEDEVRRHVGRGAEHLLSHTVPVGAMAENVRLYKQHHPSVMGPLTRVLRHVKSTLDALHAAEFALAVCSNKPVDFSRELLERLEMIALFKAVVGPEDAPRPKPAPDMLEEAVRRLEIGKKKVLYVGDMVVDIETARAAGVAVWAVPTGSEDPVRLEQARPDRFLHSFAELRELTYPVGGST